MGQKKRIDKFNEDLDAGDGMTRESEDEASRRRMKVYTDNHAKYKRLSYRHGIAAMTDAIDGENDWRESIGLERIDV